jgi:hypothetical protein
MCKEMPVIPVSKVVDPPAKKIIENMEGRGGGEAQGVGVGVGENCQKL